MKEKILTFIIGVLVGAIIATGGYYIYSKNNNKNHRGMPNGERPAMMQQDGNSTDGNGTDRGTPPEKPSDDDGNGPKEAPDKKDNSSNSKEDNTNTENNV